MTSKCFEKIDSFIGRKKKAIIQKIAEAGKKCLECRRKEHIGGILEQMFNIVTIQVAVIAKKIAIMPCLLSHYGKLAIDMDDVKLAKTILGNEDKPIRQEAAVIFGARTVQLLRRLIEIATGCSQQPCCGCWQMMCLHKQKNA
ncbi:MAG TPA: hypothetical protein PKH33_15555 [bacterium]|nr:hypothetical protein [bacterium]